ncbi:MAG TPA: hypothetical protein VKE95_09315 [Burkholderiales bacterium]|nr:hypothetical protein [Burkholderiales bacterium]
MPFRRTLRLYLDPFALFKNISIGPASARNEALLYNRRHRGILLTYVRRWAAIGVLCARGMVPLGAAAGAEPILCIPIVGLELGFSTAVFMLLVSVAVYVVLGLDD